MYLKKIKNYLNVIKNYISHEKFYNLFLFGYKFLQQFNSVSLIFIKYTLIIYILITIFETEFIYQIFLIIYQYLIEMTKYIFNYFLNLINYETLFFEFVIISLNFILMFVFLKNLKNLINTDSIFKIWICNSSFMFLIIPMTTLIFVETFYENYTLIIFILPIFVGFYYLYLEILIIPAVLKFLNENLKESNNILPMLDALKHDAQDFLVVTKSLNEVPFSKYLEKKYHLAGINFFKNMKILYFRSFSEEYKTNSSISYFYFNKNQKKNFLDLLKILKTLYMNKNNDILIFKKFLTFLNSKGYQNSECLSQVLKFLTKIENLKIIPEILKAFENKTDIQLGSNFSNTRNTRTVKILEFLIENFELFYEGLSVENFPNNIILVKTLNDTVTHLSGPVIEVDEFFKLNCYTYSLFIVHYSLQLNEEEFPFFFLNIKSGLTMYNHATTPKTYLRNDIPQDLSFFDPESDKNKLIILFRILSKFSFKFYKINSWLIVFIILYLISFITNFLYSDHFNFLILGFRNDFYALSLLSISATLLSLVFFIYKKFKITNCSEVKLNVPNSIFVFRTLIFLFLFIEVGFNFKPYFKFLIITTKCFILFLLWLYSKKINGNDSKLKIYTDFGEIFYKLNKLSIEVPFIVLLPIDAKLKPEYHIFNKYVLHFEVIMENLNFGVYSPPKDDSNT
jgi:hypothetical protein